MLYRPVALIAAVFLAVLVFAGTPAMAQSDDVGVIKTTKGTAAIERAGQRIPTAVGAKVRQGDTIVTGADGSVGVTFSDNSLLSVGPESSLSIDRFAFDSTTHKGAFETSLSRGTLAAVSGKIAKQSPDAMKVRTPSAVLGVRGTEFVVRTGVQEPTAPVR